MSDLMKCPRCKTAKNGKKFCDECGAPLERFADANGVWKPEGLWHVSTQGDEEGRSTKQLGIHEGHIADIAYSLSGEVYYDLHFRPVQALAEVNRRAPKTNVHVVLDDSGTTSMLSEARQAYFREMLKGRTDVKIKPSNYYGAVVFQFLKKEKK